MKSEQHIRQTPSDRPSRRGTPDDAGATANRTMRGVTIVELMVVIGVIGILISITVPALQAARGAARQLICLSNLSSVSKTVEAYAAVHKDTYPWVPFNSGGGGTLYPHGSNAPPGTGETIPGPFSLAIQWPLIVQDVAPWESHFQTWVCAGSPRVKGRPWEIDFAKPVRRQTFYVMTSYSYSQSFVADPSLWSAPTKSIKDKSLVSFMRPILNSEVTFPANKVMFFDHEMSHLYRLTTEARDHMPMLFADAHAAVRRASLANAPVATVVSGGATPSYFHDTRGGVHGRDY